MRFEYHVDLVLAPIPPKDMNRLGGEGWEMVSASFAPHRGWYYVFKRPLIEHAASVPVVIRSALQTVPQAAARGPIYLAWDYVVAAFKWLCARLRALWERIGWR